ncbi:LytR C-terminal domain-containing protein [Streptomyces sp. NPDC048664]|uniref:LCP family protein n=1 Tax=Streptomyces sp. NPDC048664 TaxID=3154505 RepID=UPI003431819E
MNDRYDGYTGGDQYELVGYDEFGQPVYRQVAPRQQFPQQPQGYDPYGTQQQPQGYGFDPYGAVPQQTRTPYDTGGRQPAAPYDPYDPYGPAGGADTDGGHDGHDGHEGYDPYGRTAPGSPPPRPDGRTTRIPQQAGPADGGPGQAAHGGRGPLGEDADGRAEAPGATGEPRGGDHVPGHGPDQGRGRAGEQDDEEFAFAEEADGESEDVIDWLQFTENRTERREEAKRRARSRITALVVVLVLAVVGGVGYLWYAGMLPGTSAGGASATTAATGAQNRDVIVVHLHNTEGGGTSTALLVDNTTTKQGATVLLPNSLALTPDDGETTTLAKSVSDDGSSGTSDAIDSVLGTRIEGTWRLDTPYLENLVELVGNIEVSTDADVPDPAARKGGGAPLVHKGQDQTLSGKMAVAYATYRAAGEPQDAQLERFGQVMQGVLRKISSDPQGATTTVQTLAQILDPSLSDKDLGAFLAKLADHAKSGDYKTELLPVQAGGAVGQKATDTVVKPLLGGTVSSPPDGGAVRVGVQNATGSTSTAAGARLSLVNGGYTYIDAGTTTSRTASEVLYADDGDKENAVEVAKTLGLPTGSVRKGKVTTGARVSVVLGQDYRAQQ